MSNIEIWKNITGYEELYQISNFGRVKSVGYGKECILKTWVAGNGYLQIELWKNKKRCVKNIHRLVAEAFIENTKNLPCVNHKDECKTNNNVSNLEWCSHDYNNNYGKHNEKISKSLKGNKNAIRKAVNVFNYNTGEYIGCWESLTSACDELNINKSNACLVLKGKRKQTKGYIFEYKN